MTKQKVSTADVIRSEITDYADSIQSELYEQLTLFSEDSEEYAKTQNLCQAVQKAKQEIGVSILPKQECAVLDENPNKAGAVLSAAYQQFFDNVYAETIPRGRESELENIRTKRQTTLSVLNSKLSNFVIENQDSIVEKEDIPIICKGKNQIYLQDVSYYHVDKDGSRVPADLSLFDLAVLSAVCTITEGLVADGYRQYIMTMPQIYEMLTGKPYQARTKKDKRTNSVKKCVPALCSEIEQSMRKLRSTFVAFDWREQAEYMTANGKFKQSFELPDPKKCVIIDTAVISTKIVTAKINGEVIHSAYQLLEIPPLYKYDINLSQLLSINKEMLQAPRISATKDNVTLELCLARRIELMKNSRNKMASPRIKDEYIFDVCQFDYTDKFERERKRETTKKILNCWKDEGYIKDYSVVYDGKRQTGVEIEV